MKDQLRFCETKAKLGAQIIQINGVKVQTWHRKEYLWLLEQFVRDKVVGVGEQYHRYGTKKMEEDVS